MPGTALLRLVVIVGASLVILGPARPAQAQAAQTQMTAAQMVSPTDLSAEEAAFYKTLDADAARDFIATRSYVRLCQKVEDGGLPAIQLPERPAGFNVTYLLPRDPTVVNRALADYLVARDSPDHTVNPHHNDMSPAQIVSPSALTSEEADYYKTLAADDARSFLLTRSFVRLCRQVVDRQLPALQLPDKPVGYDPDYLLPGDEAVVDQATSAALSALMQQKLK